MRPMFVGCAAIVLGALNGCAIFGSSRTEEGWVGSLQPQAFDQVLIARESVALADVVSVLVSKGYPVIWDSPEEILAQYRVRPGQIIAMNCAYLGQTKTPGGPTAAAVSCTAVDLAIGTKLYIGHGQSQVHAGQGYVAEAIGQALEKFPTKGGTGYVLGSLRLPLRQIGVHSLQPGSPVQDRDDTLPHG